MNAKPIITGINDPTAPYSVHHALRDLPADVADHALAQARESAALCLANGWDPAGELYSLESMPGDRQALEGRLGRPATSEERRGLELAIRGLISEGAAKHFAAVGSDGRRPVVWGLGSTAEEALADAAEQDSGEAGELRTVEIDAARAARINAGDVDASGL